MLKTTTILFLALLGAGAHAAQPSDETQRNETIAGAADTPQHDCACLAAETCEETETMSKTEPAVTILDSSKHHGCGWAEHRTANDFTNCPRCGGEVSNCWVRDGNGPELKTWACVRRPEASQSPGEHILQFFAYRHLPPHLQLVSKPFSELAHALVLGDNVPDSMVGRVTFGGPLPRNPERTVALRKLLEAKDAAVRALVAKSA